MTTNQPTPSAPHNFFILYVRFDRTRRRGWLASDSSALESLVSATCGPEAAVFCPKCCRTTSNSVTRKYIEKRKTTKTMKYVMRYLLPMSGSKICALSSAQTERDSVTIWYPVALTGVIAGSAARRSKQFNERRKPQGTKTKVSSFEFTTTIVKGMLQHFSAPLVTPNFNWAWLLTR